MPDDPDYCGRCFQQQYRRGYWAKSLSTLYFLCCLVVSEQRHENHYVLDIISWGEALWGTHTHTIQPVIHDVVCALRYHQVLLLWNAKGYPTSPVCLPVITGLSALSAELPTPIFIS